MELTLASSVIFQDNEGQFHILAYAADKGQVLMDREISLPKAWTDDRERCQEAGVPEHVEFATKLVLARRMLERTLEHEIPFAWVTADSVYGADYHLRRFLTEHHIPYVLAVAPNHLVPLGFKEGFESIRVDDWLRRKSRQLRWHRLSAGWGSKGPRLFDWAWWKMNAEVPEGWQAWILVRRSISDPSEIVYYRVCARNPRRRCNRSCWSPANAGKRKKPSNVASQNADSISMR